MGKIMEGKNKEVIKALAECNMSVGRAARELHYNRQTVYYRIGKIKEETGLNPLAFYDLVELLGMDGGRMGKAGERGQLDTYIDTCLDCNGIQTEGQNCRDCPVMPEVMKIVQEIRRKRGRESGT